MNFKCPKCKKKVGWEENEWRAFCSERCKMVDLGAWVLEDHKVPEAPRAYDDEAQPDE